MYSSIVNIETNYGKISCTLKDVMLSKKISIYRLSHDTNIKYEIIKKYYENDIQRFDLDILAKLCFCLNCEVSSLLKYEK